MEREGMFVVENVGRTKIYAFNPRFHFLEDVTSLGEKALSFLPDPLRDTLIFNRRRPKREGKSLWPIYHN